MEHLETLDLFSYPEQAEQYHINASALSRQLPTMIMFQDGKELGRVPGIVNGKVQKFFLLLKRLSVVEWVDKFKKSSKLTPELSLLQSAMNYLVQLGFKEPQIL